MASRCPFCGEAEETLEHLVIHRSKIWCMLLALFTLSGGCWVCHFLVKDLILGWPSLLLRKKVSKLWMAVPLCLMWEYGRRGTKYRSKMTVSLFQD